MRFFWQRDQRRANVTEQARGRAAEGARYNGTSPSTVTREARIDEALEETFPASDAPANTPTVGVRPAPPPASQR
jgi:hypothetical protein